MSIIGPIVGFAVFMVAVLVLLRVVAVVSSKRAAQRTATREAFADARGLPLADPAPESPRKGRSEEIDLNNLRMLLSEAARATSERPV